RTVILLASIVLFIVGAAGENPLLIILAIVLTVVFTIVTPGFYVVQPNQSAVLVDAARRARRLRRTPPRTESDRS
ncbi:MAG: hypothetical protein ACE5EF_08140, partial [Dehalococcoidia bacterium]